RFLPCTGDKLVCAVTDCLADFERPNNCNNSISNPKRQRLSIGSRREDSPKAAEKVSRQTRHRHRGRSRCRRSRSWKVCQGHSSNRGSNRGHHNDDCLWRAGSNRRADHVCQFLQAARPPSNRADDGRERTACARGPVKSTTGAAAAFRPASGCRADDDWHWLDRVFWRRERLGGRIVDIGPDSFPNWWWLFACMEAGYKEGQSAAVTVICGCGVD